MSLKTLRRGSTYGRPSDAIRASGIEEANELEVTASDVGDILRPSQVTPARDSALRILVTDAYYKHTLGIVRSLGRKGHKVTVLATSADDLAARSHYCSGVEYLPDSRPANVARKVVEILQRNPHDVLIPVGYATTLALAQEKEALSSLTRIETADYDQVQFAADKKRVRELAIRLGIPVPETCYPDSRQSLEACADRLRYPLVLKARQESAGITVRLVKTREMLLPTFESLCTGLNSSTNRPPMLQEFIPGHGCGFFALYERGSCKRIFMHRRIRENPPEGGISCCAESFYDTKLKELSLRLLDELQWHGVAMVEFRYDQRDRQYKLLEINPKFWGSLDLALAAGVDFPGDLCRMATGEHLPYSEEYERNLRYHWLFSGDLQHALTRPASITAVLADCLNPYVRSNVWLNDLGPTASEARSLAQAGWRKFRRS